MSVFSNLARLFLVGIALLCLTNSDEYYSESALECQAISNTLSKATDSRWREALAKTERQLKQSIQSNIKFCAIQEIYDCPDSGKEELTDIVTQLFSKDSGLKIDFRTQEELHYRYAAYARGDSRDSERIYINLDWLEEGAPVSWITQILLEEYGHALGARLNKDPEKGDVGALLAATVLEFNLAPSQFASILEERDQHEISIDGTSVIVQFASLNFINAYSVYFGEVNGNIYLADKEQNRHHFAYNDLGAASIDDQRIEDSFSGNDVVVELSINGTPYYGWISRPIKSVGIVRGFYFWVDGNFNTFNDATIDGNQDGDANPTDNDGIILVVDQDYFDNLPVEENIGGVDYKFVGSSSDRVDDALNDLIPPPMPPVATIDLANGTPGTSGGAAVESGGLNNGTAGSDAFGNVLTNDISEGSNLVVTGVGSTAANQDVTAGTTSADGTVVTGRYGTLTIGADGSYLYQVNDNLSEVQLLRLQVDELTETFVYSINDDIGFATGNLSISIQGSNDTPVAADDYNTAKESLLTDGTQYTGTDPLGRKATGNVLDNDSDVDENGETKAIQSITGSATVASTTVNEGVTNLNFIGASNLNSLNTGTDRPYLKINDTDYRALYDDTGTILSILSRTNLGGDNWDIELSSDIHAYADGIGGQVVISDISTLAGETILFTNSTSATLSSSPGGSKSAVLNAATSTATTSVSLTIADISGTITAGMTVTGNGVPLGATVTSISYDGSGNPSVLTVDEALTTPDGDSLFFSGAAGIALQGEYGDLILNSDGT